MKIIISIFLCLLSVKSLNSQCTGGNFGANLIFSQTQQTTNITGNTYYTFYADSGIRYSFYFTSANGEVTLSDSSGTIIFDHNYNQGGNNFGLLWKAPYSGNFRALMTQYPCQTIQSNLGQVTYLRYLSLIQI